MSIQTDFILIPGIGPNEDFWERILGGFTSFDMAMELYRTLFLSIRGCTSSECQCAQEAVLIDYELFFLNDTNFQELKELHYPIKENYPTRTIEEVNADPLMLNHFDPTTPSLNQFCLKYDWASYTSYHYYNDVRACAHIYSQEERQSCYLIIKHL